MKLNLQIEFDSWEEYVAFSACLPKQLAKGINVQPSLALPLPEVPPVQQSGQEKSQAKPSEQAALRQPVLTAPNSETIRQTKQNTADFAPTESMIRKLNACIEKGEPFKTRDIVGKDILRSWRKQAKINQWLQAHPNLTFTQKGALIYQPVQAQQEKSAPSDSLPQKIKKIRVFKPTEEMVRKLEEYIKKGQSFRAWDIIGPIRNAPHRTQVNQWLQSHPNLTFMREKASRDEGGRGHLIYRPLRPREDKNALQAIEPKIPSKKPVFKPSEEMLQKVEEYLQTGQPFRAKDIVGADMPRNSKQRTIIHQWLQGYSNLRCIWEKDFPEQPGRGYLMFKPILSQTDDVKKKKPKSLIENTLSETAPSERIAGEQPKPKPPAGIILKSPASTSKTALPSRLLKSTEPVIPGFKPPEEMRQKVNTFLQNGSSFHTQDVVGEKILNNPHRLAQANKWLQSHPDLVFKYQNNASGYGRGKLLYTPVQFKNGKMILPPAEKRNKSDWPMKSAAYKPLYRPPVEHSSEEEEEEGLLAPAPGRC